MTASPLPIQVSPNIMYGWCDTEILERKFGYIWTIKRFSQLRKDASRYIDSSTFSASEGGTNKWHLRVYPFGDDEKEDEKGRKISIFLHRAPNVKDDDLEVTAGFEFSILNNTRKKCNIRKEERKLFTNSRNWGWTDFIRRDELMNDLSNAFLPNDELTIFCEVVILDKLKNTSGHSKRDICVKDSERRVIEDLGRLLKSKISSDVILSAENKELKAHKAILAARSPVFAAMFEHDMEENRQNKVIISDMAYEVLEELVRFIYTGNIPSMDENMSKFLLSAADKYALEDLKMICEQLLSIDITSGKVAELIHIARLHNASYLKAQIIQFMRTRATDEVIKCLWNDIIDEHPGLVARRFETENPTEKKMYMN